LSPPLSSAVRFVAVSILLAVMVLQWFGIRISSQFQELTT